MQGDTIELQKSKNNSCTEKRLKAYKAKMMAKFKSGKVFDKYRAFLIFVNTDFSSIFLVTMVN